MVNDARKKQVRQSSQTDKRTQSAVPYTSPPPVDDSASKFFTSPLMNGAILACVILLVGFMAYNYIGHQLTKLSDESIEVAVTPTPTIVPTIDQSNYPANNQ